MCASFLTTLHRAGFAQPKKTRNGMGRRCVTSNSHQQLNISPAASLTAIEYHNVLISQSLYCLQSPPSIIETFRETTKDFTTILSCTDCFLDKQEWVILVHFFLLGNNNNAKLNSSRMWDWLYRLKFIVKVQQEIKTEGELLQFICL